VSSDPCSVYIRVLTDTGFPVPTSGLPRSSAGTRVAPTPTPSQPTSIGLALNVSHDRLASRRRANKEFYWGHSRNIRQRAHSLALNCQKFAHRRLDEQRQQQLFYGSSSYNSSSTQTPVNLSRTNSNVLTSVATVEHMIRTGRNGGRSLDPIEGIVCLLHPTSMGQPATTCRNR